MTVKSFCTILGILALAHGVGFIIAAEQMAAIYGMAISVSTILMARLFGAALLGLGLIFWFVRESSPENVRAVFIATVIANTIGLIVVALGTLAGTLNALGWFAAIIYLFGAAGSGYFLTLGSRPVLSGKL